MHKFKINVTITYLASVNYYTNSFNRFKQSNLDSSTALVQTFKMLNNSLPLQCSIGRIAHVKDCYENRVY